MIHQEELTDQKSGKQVRRNRLFGPVQQTGRLPSVVTVWECRAMMQRVCCPVSRLLLIFCEAVWPSEEEQLI